jgi:hypothetical protein
MAVISASTFNGIQQKAVGILGTGGVIPGTVTADSRYGYGQSTVSAPVAVGNIIRATSWVNLRSDLVKARTHQIGSVGTGTGVGPAWANLVSISSGTVISSTIVTQYQGVAAQLLTDKFTAFSSQLGSTAVSSVRTATWGLTGVLPAITHSFRTTFSDATQARYYFNSGGVIKYAATLTGGGLLAGNLAKYNAWVNTLSGMGTLTFAINQSSSTFGAFTVTKTGGTGTTTSITLSAVDQVIYTTTMASPYATNTLTISAKYITNTTPYVIEITAVYTDGVPGAPSGIGPAVDELVDGTLTGTATITPIIGAFAITPTIANQLTL